MTLIPLPFEEQVASGFTHKAILTYADLTGETGATKTIAIFPESGTFPAATIIRRMALKLVTAFTSDDEHANSLLVECGDAGDTDRLLAQTELLEAATEILALASANTYAYLEADTLDALFTVAVSAGDAKLSELTAGEVHLYFTVLPLDQY